MSSSPRSAARLEFLAAPTSIHAILALDKRIVGPRLRAVNEDAREVEAAAACDVLNRMAGVGRARSVRVVAVGDA